MPAPTGLYQLADIHQKIKRKDYAFGRQFNEKPSIISGCPEKISAHCRDLCLWLRLTDHQDLHQI